jgi:putative serine protease PepD
VAVVAAVIGAGVGAGVARATEPTSTSSPSVTVHEGSAAPGPGMLSTTASIPELVNKVLPAVVSIDVKYGQEEDEGTGMIISSSGEVVTNNHVIALAAAGGTMTVTRAGTTKTMPATLIGTDPSSDVALVQVTGGSKLPTITFGDSNKAEVGDAVVAIGNALGLQAGTPTVTQGIVSALGRTVTAGDALSGSSETLTNMIQTDAAINPGNSGGPLIDTAGQVIGMNTAVAGSTSEGTSAQNIGFAIPSAKIEALLPQLQKGGTVQSGGAALGVSVTTLTPQLRQEYGFTPSAGAVILEVVPGSPAARAHLREGDVIVGVGSATIKTAEQLQSAIQKNKPGAKVQVTFYVGDLRQTATVTLESQSQEQQQTGAQPTIGGTTTTGGGTTSRGTSTAGSGVSPFGGF